MFNFAKQSYLVSTVAHSSIVTPDSVNVLGGTGYFLVYGSN